MTASTISATPRTGRKDLLSQGQDGTNTNVKLELARQGTALQARQPGQGPVVDMDHRSAVCPCNHHAKLQQAAPESTWTPHPAWGWIKVAQDTGRQL